MTTLQTDSHDRYLDEIEDSVGLSSEAEVGMRMKGQAFPIW